jgi:hypothetical protein
MDAVSDRGKVFRRTGNIVLLALVILLILSIVYTWDTRDNMLRLPFNGGAARARAMKEKSLVDVGPWQTAQALTALAVTAEEMEYAREAERLADHEVDQAFAAALRQASMQVQRSTLSGRALELSQRVDGLQQLMNQDMAQLDELMKAPATPAGGKGAAAPTVDNTDVEIAKAQLQLDSDQLDDAQQDLARASGDNRARIQAEYTAREAAVKKYESEGHSNGQIAAVVAGRIGTLAGRIGAWNRQRTRYQLLQRAQQQALADIQELSAEHQALEEQSAKEQAASQAGAQDRSARLASIQDRSAERQLLSILEDRAETQQELATIYSKWSDQVLRQRRIVQHLIVQSVAIIVFILICMILGARLVRRLMTRPSLDRRETQTLRMILETSVQVIGAVLILFVLFGAPRQTSTILGLTTAALTIALQDFIISFLGWFRLIGKRGIRVGDWVEINGVAGEVVEIGLITTALLETGNRGYRTGRRISFMNSFAIRGQFFNFSTTGHWMWDEFTVSLPSSAQSQGTVKRIFEVVSEETGQSARMAAEEWKRGAPHDEFYKSRTDPSVNLRPSGSAVDLDIRYVTRAWERVEMRNRLYSRVLDLLQKKPAESHPPV